MGNGYPSQRGGAASSDPGAQRLRRLHTGPSKPTGIESLHDSSEGGHSTGPLHVGGRHSEAQGGSERSSSCDIPEDEMAEGTGQGIGTRLQSGKETEAATAMVGRKAQSGLLAFFGRPEKHSPSYGAPSDTSGGQSLGSPTGHAGNRVPQKSRAGQASFGRLEHSAGTLFGRQTLAGAKREVSQPGETAFESGAARLDAGCDDESGQATRNRPDAERGCRKERIGGERSVPLSAMGGGQKGIRGFGSAAPVVHRGDRVAHLSEATSGPSTRNLPLSRSTKAHSGDDLRNRRVHARDPKPLAGVATGLLPAQQDQQKLVHPSHISNHEASQARQVASGEHGRPSAPRLVSSLLPEGRQQLRNLQLSNTSNYCYANASVLAVMWTISHLQESHRTALVEGFHKIHRLAFNSDTASAAVAHHAVAIHH